jgi:S-DNA-T family DNA segregation ATPase FtsK/SpoIIIE
MGTVREIHPGPVVTTYEFKPDAGVKYSKIVGLADDLALALEAESIRIDRVSGKGNVGIEIPNVTRETIYLREVLESRSSSAPRPAHARARQGRERRRLGDRPRRPCLTS